MLSVKELLTEDIPARVAGGLLDDDFGVVVGQLEDNKLVALLQLHLTECSVALGGDLNSE